MSVALIIKDGRMGLTAEDLAPMSEEGIAKLFSFLQDLDGTTGQQEDHPPEEEEPEEEEPEIETASEAPPPASNTGGCSDELQALAAKANELGGIPAAIAQIDAFIIANTARRAKLIEGLTANSACAFKADELATMSNEHLETLSKSLSPLELDFSGQAAPISATNRDRVITLPSLMG